MKGCGNELVGQVAQDSAVDRSTALASVAEELSVTASDVERGLYADLPDARLLKPRNPPPSVPELMERYNLALAQSLLWRAEQLTIHVRAQIKAVLRPARLRGLLCLAENDPTNGGAVLRLSGPLALFHQTIKYGHAMASWLPVLIRTPRWSLEATCVIRGERYLWRASYRDLLGTTHVPPRRFDSKVEERLFRDLKRLGTSWEVHREADVVQIGRRIASPDFTLVDAERHLRVPVEVVGFWTPEYLRDKLELLSCLPRYKPWVVCVDSSLRPAAADRGFGQNQVIWYTRRIDAAGLLQFIEQRRARWEVSRASLRKANARASSLSLNSPRATPSSTACTRGRSGTRPPMRTNSGCCP